MTEASNPSKDQTLDPDLCVHCPNLCMFTCPATLGGGSTTTSPFGKVTALHWADTTDLLRPEDVSHLPFLCTGCDLCTEICAHDQPVAQFLYEKRASLFRDQQTPEGYASMLPDEEALRAVLVSAAEKLEQKGPPRVVFAPGCSMISQGVDRVVEVVQLLTRLGVSNIGVDPDAPICCGAPWRDLGNTAEFLGRASHWRRLFSQREGVLLGDPRCLRALTEQVPPPLDMRFKPRILSLRRFLSRAIHSRLREPLDLRVVVHVSCHAARNLERDPPPTELLEAILKFPPLTLAFHGSEAQCCGGSGGMDHVAPQLTLAASRSILERASLLKVDCVLTLSPTCAQTLTRARGDDQELPRPIELIDLVRMALGVQREQTP